MPNWQILPSKVIVNNAEVNLIGFSFEKETYCNSILKYLSIAEKDRACNFKFETHQQSYSMFHAFLRYVLAAYCNTAPELLEFYCNKYNKPFLKNHPEIQFNLSHSDTEAIIAVTYGQPIGVDIEKIKPKFPQELAKRFFSAAEAAYLDSLPESEQAIAFYQLWSHKEAFIKAIGRGLSQNLKKFVIGLNPSTLIRADDFDINNWHVENFSWHPDFASTFATGQKVKTMRYFKVEQGRIIAKINSY